MTIRLLRTAATVAFSAMLAAAATGTPIVFNGKTLFTIQSGVGAFSAEERAHAVEDRLARLSKDPLSKVDHLTVTRGEISTDIDAGDVVILALTNRDAEAAGRPREALADEYAKTLQAALLDSRKEHSLKERLRDTALSVAVTIGLVLLLWLLRIGFKRLRSLLESWHGTRIRGVQLQRLELLPAERVTWLLISVSRIVHVLAVVVVIYFYTLLVLSIFPSTRALSAGLFTYIDSVVSVAGKALAEYTPSLLTIAIIAVIARYVVKLCRYIFRGIEVGKVTIPGFYTEWAEPTYKIVRFLVLVIAAIIVFPYIPGHDSTAFRGLSIFFGLLVSLGSAGAVGNIVAGVLLTYTRAFQAGDRVKIGDTMGDIVENTLLATRIRTIKNEEVTVPNSMVLTSHIVNFSSCCRGSALILHTSVTIGYDAPWRKVHQLLISAALATEEILPDPQPFVLQTGLSDFYVDYQINAYTTNPSHMVKIYSDLHQNIQDKFNEAGVEICSPHFAALRDGNRVTIPEHYVPRAYNAPSFRLFATGNGADTTEGTSPLQK